MEFRAIFVANPAHLSVQRGQLIIKQQQKTSVPMEDITSLLLESQAVTITAAALQQLTDHGVTVYLCDEKHMPATVALSINRHSRQRKLLGGQIAMTKPATKRLWKQIVTAKIANQAQCLSLLRRRGVEELRFLSNEVRSGDPDNYEASAAALYFPALFGQGFTRGEDSVVNAGLNYGYAIVRGAVARNLAAYGLEPCLGLFHHSQLNQFNLADDLMEPYRPLVDLFVAQHLADSKDEQLNPELKRQLFNLTNYLVQQGQQRLRLIVAIGRCVASLSRVVQGEGARLELPHLLPLEPYRYE